MTRLESGQKGACAALQVGKFSFMANSRARSVSDTEGLVKFVSDAQTDKILGVHIMGPNAGELISECVLVRGRAPSCALTWNAGRCFLYCVGCKCWPMHVDSDGLCLDGSMCFAHPLATTARLQSSCSGFGHCLSACVQLHRARNARNPFKWVHFNLRI